MRGWIVDVAAGGIGGAVGAIAAVNLVIYAGIDGGYEASIGDVFRQGLLTGILAVMLLIAGPVIGVAVARLLRSARQGQK